MPTAHDLIAKKVAEGVETDRLGDLAVKIQTQDVHYCVVVSASDHHFVGLVRLAEVAVRSHAPNRILADLISPVKPLIVRANEPAAQVAQLFSQYQISEAVVLDARGTYLGLITARNVLEWSERQRERAEISLREARAQLEAAKRAETQLIERLSHELRTPLVPVLLLASQGAADPSVPSTLRRNFEDIAEFVAHEARLIDDLLDQKTIQRGAMAVIRVSISLDHILQKVIAGVRSEIAAKSIAFDYQCAAENTVLSGDSNRLRQAFENLLNNAVKFTPSGGKISLKVTNSPGTTSVAVTLQDTGIGFSQEEQQHAFSPFARSSGAVPHQAAAYPGLGLGLSIARAIVELHDGSIEMTSDGRDLGSTLVVTLPLLRTA